MHGLYPGVQFGAGAAAEDAAAALEAAARLAAAAREAAALEAAALLAAARLAAAARETAAREAAAREAAALEAAALLAAARDAASDVVVSFEVDTVATLVAAGVPVGLSLPELQAPTAKPTRQSVKTAATPVALFCPPARHFPGVTSARSRLPAGRPWRLGGVWPLSRLRRPIDQALRSQRIRRRPLRSLVENCRAIVPPERRPKRSATSG
jgi:hypothetical protein